MAPLVASSSLGTGTASFAVAVPTGTVNGDLLVAVNASDWNTLANNGLPAGFTALATSDYDGGNNDVHVAIGYRTASAEPASYTFPVQNSDNVGALLRVTGHDSTPTIAQVAPNAANQGLTAPSITPNGADDLLLTFHCTEQSAGGTGTWTPPPGMTEHVDGQSNTWTSLLVASLQNPASPSGTKTATFSISADNGGACTISIKAAAAGGTPVQGAAVLSASGTLTGAGKATSRAASALTAESGLTAAGLARSRAAAALAADGVSVTSGRVRAQAAAALSGQATVTIIGRVRAVAAATLSADGTLTVSTGAVRGAAVLAATATLAVTGRARAVALTVLTGESAMTAAGLARARGAAALAGAGTLGVLARVRVVAAAALSAVGGLLAAGNLPGQVPAHPEILDAIAVTAHRDLTAIENGHELVTVGEPLTVTAIEED